MKIKVILHDAEEGGYWASVPALPGLEAAATFTFDLASDLLTAQRDFTLGLAKAFTAQKSA